MKKLWIGTQIFINKKRYLTFEDFKRTIFNAKKILNLNSLMLWANNDFNLYENIIEICREFGIEPYLWYPVLSDIPSFKTNEEHLTLNFDGTYGYGKIGRWIDFRNNEENFLFICPNNKIVNNKLFESFKETVDNFNFEGILLDRIRFPSCANGFESIFSCFCKFCKEKFYKNYCLHIEKYKKLINDFVNNFKKFTNEDIESWQRFEYIWELIGIKEFIDFKESSIYDLVKKFADYARLKSKKVGLDLYSYSISPLVSQNYKKLQDSCDWIKPMVYCHATGPAGIPLEIYCLASAFKVINNSLSNSSLKKFFENILKIRLSKNLDDILEKGISEKFLSVELKKIKKLNLSKEVKIYPGFEAVKIPGVCIINKEILSYYIEQIFNEVEGFILSWDLLNIPESNLKFIGKKLRQK